MRPRILERELRDPPRRPRRDHLDTLDHPRRDLMLDSRVQVLRILAHHDQIDLVERRMHSGEVHRRPHVGVEVEGAPQMHVDRAPAFRHPRLERPLERDPRAFERFDQRVGHRRAEAPKRIHPRDLPIPFDTDAGRLDHRQRRAHHFRPDAVARNQRHRTLARSFRTCRFARSLRLFFSFQNLSCARRSPVLTSPCPRDLCITRLASPPLSLLGRGSKVRVHLQRAFFRARFKILPLLRIRSQVMQSSRTSSGNWTGHSAPLVIHQSEKNVAHVGPARPGHEQTARRCEKIV